MHHGHELVFGPNHHHQGHPVFWLLLVVLFLALLAVAVYSLIRMSRSTRPQAAAVAGPDAAVDSVRMRYARGEIDRDEFIRVATDLGAPPPAAAV